MKKNLPWEYDDSPILIFVTVLSGVARAASIFFFRLKRWWRSAATVNFNNFR